MGFFLELGTGSGDVLVLDVFAARSADFGAIKTVDVTDKENKSTLSTFYWRTVYTLKGIIKVKDTQNACEFCSTVFESDDFLIEKLVLMEIGMDVVTSKLLIPRSREPNNEPSLRKASLMWDCHPREAKGDGQTVEGLLKDKKYKTIVDADIQEVLRMLEGNSLAERLEDIVAYE
uniref:Uncharacterized protein n=1 Tax=Solanum lycopersicum TaxID=4081 RepID=A0A3Q7EE82_SOLLC